MSKQQHPDHIKFRRELRLRIRKLRKDRGWTLEESEEHGDVSWRHLQRIESGSNFTIHTLWKICQLYKVSFSELFKKL